MSAELPLDALVRRAPLSPLLLGIAVTLAIWSVNILLGFDPSTGEFQQRIVYSLGLTIGYLLAVSPWAVRRTQEDLDALRPCWNGSGEEFARTRAALGGLPPRTAALALAGGLVLAAAFQQGLYGRFTTGLPWSLADGWAVLVAMLLWGMSLPLIVISVRNTLRLRDVGAHRLAVPLWGAGQGTPLARFGLRLVGVWLIGPLVLTGVAASSGGALNVTTLVIVVGNLLLASVCLIVPASGLRRQLQRRKRAELERIDRALAGDSPRLVGSELGEEARGFDRLQLLQSPPPWWSAASTWSSTASAPSPG